MILRSLRKFSSLSAMLIVRSGGVDAGVFCKPPHNVMLFTRTEHIFQRIRIADIRINGFLNI